MHARRLAYIRGLLAEWYCMIWLVLKGYQILAHRFKLPQGEIDVVARRGRMLVFVEVKARAGLQEALHSITTGKRERTMRAAQGFIARHACFAQHDLRFDVMMVTSRWRIHHLKHAWSLT